MEVRHLAHLDAVIAEPLQFLRLVPLARPHHERYGDSSIHGFDHGVLKMAPEADIGRDERDELRRVPDDLEDLGSTSSSEKTESLAPPGRVSVKDDSTANPIDMCVL